MKKVLAMLKDRKYIIIILSTLLFLQIILFIYFNIFSFQSLKLRAIGKKLIKEYNKETVIALEISDLRNSFEIRREKGFWFVKEKDILIPADFEKVNFYLDTLENLNQGIIRYSGEDKETIKKYGFTDESVRKLIIKTFNKKDFYIYIGDPGQNKGTSYIRLNNEKEIRELKSYIATETDKEPIKWALRKIFRENIDTEEVQSCEFSANLFWFKGSYTIKNQEEKNVENFILVPNPYKKLKPDILQNTINNIVQLKIDGYIFSRNVSDKESLASIKLILKTGKSYILRFYKAEENDSGNFILDVDFNDYLYLINEASAKLILKPIKDFIETKTQ